MDVMGSTEQGDGPERPSPPPCQYREAGHRLHIQKGRPTEFTLLAAALCDQLRGDSSHAIAMKPGTLAYSAASAALKVALGRIAMPALSTDGR